MINYSFLLNAISETRQVVHIDLKTLSLTLDKTPIIKDGKGVHPDGKYILMEMFSTAMAIPDAIHSIVVAYGRYRNSRPTAFSDRHKSRYFSALPYEDLSAESREFGAAREVEQFRLEFLVLSLACQHPKFIQSLFPDGRYFWTPKKGSPLIIRKDWFPASLFE